MDNKEIRARNIAWLVDTHGGPTAFGKVIDRDQVQVSQWLGGKGLGDRLARHIEGKLGHFTGWLDQPQWPEALNQSQGASRPSHATRPDPEMLADAAKALLIVLRRRDPAAALDVANLDDATLLCDAYAAALEVDGALEFGAAVADLLQAREAKRGRQGEQTGSVDRGKARSKAASG